MKHSAVWQFNRNPLVWRHVLVKPLGDVLLNLFYLSAGCALCVVSLNGILVPHGFASGGVVGLTLVLKELFPALSLSWLYALLNLPLFFLGWRVLKLNFLIYSLVGTAVFTLMVDLFPVILPVSEPIPAAVLAGLLGGAGGGLILKSQGSAGGGDILGVILLRKYCIRIGSTVLAMNILVLGACIIIYPLEILVYTLIYIFVTARVVDVVVVGLSRRKMVLVVSQKAQNIADQLLHDKSAGATMLQTQGAFSGEQGQALLSAVTYRQLGAFKQSVQEIDPKAFIVVSDTLEVSGSRVKGSSFFR
jgi:uncharacterized membrane-anchored protein YitT (DUF2179 family)